MAPNWAASTDKHGVPRYDQIYVLLNPNYVAVLSVEKFASGRVVLFIGFAHAQTTQEVEILVHEHPETGETATIFHARYLGPKFNRYREEHPNG